MYRMYGNGNVTYFRRCDDYVCFSFFFFRKLSENEVIYGTSNIDEKKVQFFIFASLLPLKKNFSSFLLSNSNPLF